MAPQQTAPQTSACSRELARVTFLLLLATACKRTEEVLLRASRRTWPSAESQTGGVLQVTYTFAETTVPEPVTMSLVGGALIGLAAVTRARRAKSN